MGVDVLEPPDFGGEFIAWVETGVGGHNDYAGPPADEATYAAERDETFVREASTSR